MLTETQIKEMFRSARRIAKEEGKTLDDILVLIAYGKSSRVSIRDQLAAIKIFKDFTMSKTSEQNVNISDTRGPVIGLPELKEDPSKVVHLDRSKNQ